MFQIDLKQDVENQASLTHAGSDELYSVGGSDLFEHKVALWQRENTGLTRRIRICVGDTEELRVLLALIRTIKADEGDYYRLISSRGDGRDGGFYRSVRNAFIPISIRNEAATLRAFMLLCQNMLALYPTTLAEDLHELRPENIDNLPLYSNRRNALIHIRGEKEVLTHYLTYCQCGLSLLSIPEEAEEEYQSTLKAIGQQQSPLIYQYCKNFVTTVRNQEYQRTGRIARDLDLTRPTVV